MSKLISFVVREVREALPAASFFLVLFHLLALTKVVLLEDAHWSSLRAAGATIGALVVAKAVLVVDALPVPRFAGVSHLRQLCWRSSLGALVVLLFQVLEEWLPRLRSKGPAGAWRGMLAEVRWPVSGVLTLWILGGLALYTLVGEMARALGAGGLRAFLRRAPDA